MSFNNYASIYNIHVNVICFLNNTKKGQYQIDLSDFVGYLKSWASSVDLVSVLKNEIRDGQLTFRGKRVLEVTCRKRLLLAIMP